MRLFNIQPLHDTQRHAPPSYHGRAQGHRYGGRGPRAVGASSQAGAGNHHVVESDPARAILQRMADDDRAA